MAGQKNIDASSFTAIANISRQNVIDKTPPFAGNTIIKCEYLNVTLSEQVGKNTMFGKPK